VEYLHRDTDSPGADVHRYAQPDRIGGIIRIGAIAGDMAQAGIIALISFTALLSINLGLINLFPIPMLDGGHLVFYAVEAARGSPIPEKMQEYAFRFGLAVLVGIMIFANLNDLIQLIL
jgi:regulator of sigma E protease